ncbi:MAG: N-acetyl-gamma-glutamyl-phosphate reductase [Planctomycetes bacterium]|nr:N-acetyl-gamma-glutamyl-phosphate reductase [Planctomycetota bacterium]
MTYRVGIVGASGYAGYELLRLLDRHPSVEVVALNSASMGGRPVRDLYPDYAGARLFTDLPLDELNALELDVLFLAMHEGYARESRPKLRARVIDLSRDYRLDPEAAYGLPEFFRAGLRDARLVSNPGCYVTSCLLAGRPVARAGWVRHFVFDSKSGYSGAGRAPSYVNDPAHFGDNLIPYKLTDHRHAPEIRRFLPGPVSFTPHVLPLFRGLLTTMHALLDKPRDAAAVRRLYEEAYAGERFVRILDRIPELHDVQGTNLCCLGGFEVDETGRLVVISVLDNLVKGASGQAVQNMNLMLGLEEGTAIESLPPVHRRG